MKTRFLPVLPALVLVLAACGGGGGDALERVQAAQQTTLDAGSAAFTIEQAVEGVPGGEDRTVNSEGEVDFEASSGRVRIQVPDTGFGGGEIETLFDGETIYLRLPEGAAPTPWVRFDLEDLEGLPGFEGFQDASSDPSGTLGFVAGATGDVEEVGEEEVRGVDATHYRFTVDLDQAVENAPDDLQDALRRQADTLGVDELPTEVWLDGDGRIVRQSFEIDLADTELSTPADGTTPPELEGGVTTTIEYYDFGLDVEVEPPPAAEVTDFTELLEAQQSATEG
jgi:hypothetical protein